MFSRTNMNFNMVMRPRNISNNNSNQSSSFVMPNTNASTIRARPMAIHQLNSIQAIISSPKTSCGCGGQ